MKPKQESHKILVGQMDEISNKNSTLLATTRKSLCQVFSVFLFFWALSSWSLNRFSGKTKKMAEIQVHRKFAVEKLGETLFRDFLKWAKRKNISGEELLGDMSKTLYYVSLFGQENDNIQKSSPVTVKGLGKAVFDEKEFLQKFRSVDSLEILDIKKITPQKGWGIVAKRDLKKLNPVLDLKPSWFITLAKNVCCFCGYEEATISCKYCDNESYCSVYCRQKAQETYHDLLCKKDVSKMMDKAKNSLVAGSKYHLFVSKIFSHMIMHDKKSWKDVDSLKFLSGFQSALLNVEGYKVGYQVLCELFEKEKFSERMDFDEYMKLISVIVLNVFGWHQDVDGPVSPTTENMAIFCFGSFFNHSCVPNCEYYFREGKMYFVCVEPTKKGEELFISYIGDCPNFEARKKALLIYGFSCECPLCQKDCKEVEKEESQ